MTASGDSFETERHRDDQPERDDLIDPEDIDAEPVDEDRYDPGEGILPDPEERPESQGADILDAERLTEDAAERPPLHDEEP